MNLFVTGTDTDVGKTYIMVLLLKALKSRAVGMKPIETGGGGDAQRLHAAMGGAIDLQQINPIRFNLPLAPAVAAEREDKPIVKQTIFTNYSQLVDKNRIVIVEGAGGWRVPIERGYDMADLAWDLSTIAPLQVLVVALDRLGVINHTCLTIESIRARGLVCAGFVLNQGPCLKTPATDLEMTLTHAEWITKGSQSPFWFAVQSGQTILSNSDIHWFSEGGKPNAIH